MSQTLDDAPDEVLPSNLSLPASIPLKENCFENMKINSEIPQQIVFSGIRYYKQSKWQNIILIIF